mmetsp:Transcript_11850/g.26954  ORF Transcript_11850/g.26954 Transcript_11850/m.26954 type:complete len:456 (+) Transcript_11850:70-1437(+)
MLLPIRCCLCLCAGLAIAAARGTPEPAAETESPSQDTGDPSSDHPIVRVFAQENVGSWGLRICAAFRKFAPPWVHFVNEGGVSGSLPTEPYDVAIMHEDCSTGTTYTHDLLLESKHPVVLVQHCYKFHGGRGAVFEEMWKHAMLTVSYHNLTKEAQAGSFAFLHTPWGVDGQAFRPPASGVERNNTVIILGAGRPEKDGWTFDDESHMELLQAAALANTKVRHIGDEMNRLCGDCGEYQDCVRLNQTFPLGRSDALLSSLFARPTSQRRYGTQLPEVNQFNKKCQQVPRQCQKSPELSGKTLCDFHINLGRISEEDLHAELQATKYVSALRKFEGFEIPGIEALFSGARPIIYDFIPGYAWYYKHGVEVTSIHADQLVGQLRDVLLREPNPVSSEELSFLRAKFDWNVIVPHMFNTAFAELTSPRWLDTFQATQAVSSPARKKKLLLRRGKKNDL